MKTSIKAIVLGAAGAVLIAGASAAWACTATTSVSLLADSVGARERVALVGETLQSGPVEVRWNSINGPVMAQGTVAEKIGSFATEISVPDVSPGVYYVVLISGDTAARAPLQVTAAGESRAATGVSAELWTGFTNSPTTALEGVQTQAPADSRSAYLLMGVAMVVFASTGLLAALVLLRPKGAFAGRH